MNIENKLKLSQKTFDTWKSVPFKDKQKLLKKLAKVSSKFFLPFNVPNVVLKSVLGEMSSIILEGTRVDNKKIKSAGFDFKYKSLNEAFDSLVKK